MKRTHRSLLVVALAALTAGSLAAQKPKPHPRLANLETTRCVNCHGELLEDKKFVHPPVEDDCTTCHEMTLGEEGTTVALMDAEPALCVFCHDEKTRAVEAELASPHFPVTDSCLNCHNPHASDNARLLVDPVPQLCTLCHDLSDLQGKHGEQLTEGTNCLQCHQPHGSENPRLLAGSRLHPPFADGTCESCHRKPFGDRIRLRARGQKLCAACHGDKTEDGKDGGTVHGALEDDRGRAGCLNCHNPHMSDQARLLKEPRPALCGECHGDVVKAALAPTGHFPAADDCLNCHQPHASEQWRLLNEPIEELCVFCHDPGDPDLSKAHLGADPAKLTCIRCHTPHGDGNPKLLAQNVHPPVLDGCDICHEGSYKKLMEGGPPELCLFCHDEIGEIVEKAPVPHGALEFGTCTDCHNPHASAQQRLIKTPGAGPCIDCHDDKAPGPGEKGHSVIDLLGCRACHEPHGGTLPKLLRKEPPQLCLSCHLPGAIPIDESTQTARLLDHFEVPAARVRTMAVLRLSADGERDHPVANHRVQGMPTAKERRRVQTTFEGELTCLVCHDPHKGRWKLLRWDAASTAGACLNCHPR